MSAVDAALEPVQAPLGHLDNGNFSDASNAGYLEVKMVPDWIWSYPRRQWLHWTGHRFEPDNRDRVINRALVLMRARTVYFAALDGHGKAKALASAVACESLPRVRAALELLKSFASINGRGFDLDKNPLLLGVANGVLDFTRADPTGESVFRSGRPEDLITKSNGINYDHEPRCARFPKFVNEIFKGDVELMEWFQRAVGYSLTGSTREQVIFMCYGSGANGKSVLLNVLRLLLGEYAVNLPMAALERETNPGPNRASPDLMMIRGMRLATSSEVSSASQLSESRVKALTGSDEVTGRELNKMNETFRPEAKYYLAVNHLPVIKDDSDGFWRRMRCIPFLQKFTYEGSEERGDLRDDNLEATLAGELPGILAWAVRGTLDWLDLGLGDTPEAVSAATSSYQTESDPYSAFIEEKCVIAPANVVSAAALYDDYKNWATDNGLSPRETKTSTQFGRDIGSRYLRGKAPVTRRTIYTGIGLAREAQQASFTLPPGPSPAAFVQ